MHSRTARGADVLVVQVDVGEVDERLPLALRHALVGDLEGAGGAHVRPHVPREGLDLRDAGLVVAAQLVDAVGDVARCVRVRVRGGRRGLRRGW